MRINAYLEKPVVREFINWVGQRLDKENSFNHSYIDARRHRRWCCNSIYNAYENYTWKGENFTNTQKKLSGYRKNLNDALSINNAKETKNACISILKWGGVTGGNREAIERMDDIVNCLLRTRGEIAPNTFDTDQNAANITINSGFSKIYSLLVDNFIIYDSRVSSALCYLVRLFCEQNRCREMDENLRFAFSSGRRGQNRNPNSGNYVFPGLSSHNYLEKNIKASWLLSGILKNTKSKFNDLHPDTQLRALEAALFMTGYEIRNNAGNEDVRQGGA